jgi:hypothetical protein
MIEFGPFALTASSHKYDKNSNTDVYVLKASYGKYISCGYITFTFLDGEFRKCDYCISEMAFSSSFTEKLFFTTVPKITEKTIIAEMAMEKVEAVK